MEYKYLFGPVPSRRLGISLGVDLVPLKYCTLDCVYCEVGKTTNLIIERKELVPFEDVIRELDHFLGEKPKLDYITFSGSGEPTLHNKIGEIITHIKGNYSGYKLALLTNSTLMSNESLRGELQQLDLILPSLDAASQDIFEKINRPHRNLRVEDIIEGLVKFNEYFSGKMWLEIFLLPGINDTDDEIIRLKEAAEKISPDKVQLNSLDRPGTEKNIHKLSGKRFAEIAAMMEPLPVEIISKFVVSNISGGYNRNVEELILTMITRRPCTIEDLSAITGLKPAEISKYTGSLLDNGKAGVKDMERGRFYYLLPDNISE